MNINLTNITYYYSNVYYLHIRNTGCKQYQRFLLSGIHPSFWLNLHKTPADKPWKTAKIQWNDWTEKILHDNLMNTIFY